MEMIEEKMKIGIDIDDVVVYYSKHFLDFYEEKTGRRFFPEDIFCFEMWKPLGDSEERVMALAQEFNERGLSMKQEFIEGAQASITELSRECELVFVTSRPFSEKENLSNLFGKGLPNVNLEIFFTEKNFGNKKTKVQICKELGIPILIEDRRKYALECAQNGIKVLLFDKPWNRENCEHENIIRVKNWKEILEKIEEMKDKSENKRKNIIEEVRKFVEEECRKPTSKYGYAPFEDHFIPMKNYAVRLAIEKGLDTELIEIAAWLHDIGSIIYGRENHHITGAEIAEKKLKELDYPEEKIERIKKCILNHRGSVDSFRGSSEEQVIAEADALVNFDNVTGIFEASFIEGKSRNEAKKSVKQKLINKYNQLSGEGKRLIKPKYEAAMLLLN